MRMSCNGCRVLRKGCSENCSIRPCLQWIISSESQANATVFLAKFYGRAGLMNLINAGPEHLRPAIFRSLLYEACGRIVNPIYGAVGLLCSGSWQLCQNAVDAVLGGSPITTIASDAAAASVPPIKGCDIRHVAKDENSAATESAPPTRCFDVEHGMEDENSAAASGELHRVKTRTPFKRSRVVKPKPTKAVATPVKVSPVDQSIHPCGGGSTSHESTVSHETAGESMLSDETAVARAAAAVAVAGSEPEEVAKNAMDDEAEEDSELDLDLTLGFRAISRIREPTAKSNGGLPGGGACKMELGLDHSC